MPNGPLDRMPEPSSNANRRVASSLRRKKRVRKGLSGFSVGFSMAMFLAAFFLFLGGFVQFVEGLPKGFNHDAEADAVVVLTGGDARLTAGLELVKGGKAKRMLLSGVHLRTEKEDIQKLLPEELHETLQCCVDLGRIAQNTKGNARETALWIHENEFSSIIVVTASYHMPRSILEISHASPETDLVVYPVFPQDVRIRGWWKHPGTTRLLLSEYAKYLASLARFRLELGETD